MATKKTTPASKSSTPGIAKGTSTRKPMAKISTKAVPKTTVKSSAKKASAKADPVILDSSKPSVKKSEFKGATIDAKAVEVKPTEVPKVKVEEPKPTPELPKELAETKPPTSKIGDKPAKNGYATTLGAMMIGGVVAAGIGYLANDYANPDTQAEQAAEINRLTTDFDETIASLQARIKTLEAAEENIPLSKIEQEVSEIKEALTVQLTALAKRLSENEAALADALSAMDAARQRLTEIITAGSGELREATAELIAQYGAEIDNLKSRIEAQIAYRAVLEAKIDKIVDGASTQLTEARAKVAELSETAMNVAKTVDLSLARERLNAAVETGKSYGGQLSALAAAAAIDIPEALLEDAKTGVLTLAELQKSFPAAARKGLKASVRADADDTTTSRVMAFLKSQIGARSLEEKDGDDPNAILSRAEGALNRDDLQAAFDLVNQLSEPGKVAMAVWLEDAEHLLSVRAALNEFDASIEKLDGAE